MASTESPSSAADGGDSASDVAPPTAERRDVAATSADPSNLITGAATASWDDSAFSTWRDALTRTVTLESRALLDGVIDLQREFDDASQYIRGDYAWRKQVSALHDRTNDAVTARMEALASQLQQSTQSLGQSLEETLRAKDALAKEEIQRQVTMYEDKLRRTRTSLKKEVDRFTLLEKCLRKEESHQAKATYERLVEQLRLEHAAKEATLQAMLRELKLSYVTIENANGQLIETVKSRGEEIERLKKMLPKASAATQRGTNSMRLVSAAPPAAIVGVATDAYVHTLKQSVSSANTTIDSLRIQIDEAKAEREAILKRQHQTEEMAGKINEELVKAKVLLSESHSALIANRKETEALLQEKTHWKELYSDLHFQSSSHEHELDDCKRLAAATQRRLESVERNCLEGAGTILGGAVDSFIGRWTQWRQETGGQLTPEGLSVVDSFVEQIKEASAGDKCSVEVETKLHFEFEKRYSEMLNIRINHERKRVVARIEMLWNKRACSTKQSRKRTTQVPEGRRSATKQTIGVSADHPPRGLPLRQVLELVSEAFQDLGFSEWNTLDVEALHSQLATQRELLSVQEQANKTLQEHIEAQALNSVKTDLLLREKELLLAELTDRCRSLRSQVESLQEQARDPAPSLDLSAWDTRDPFTVYGQSQRIEEKRKVARARPVSASATLTHNERSPMTTPTPKRLDDICATKRAHGQQPPLKSFLVSHLSLVDTPNPSSLSKTPQQLEDHVRSVLKAELLSLTPTENQLDDGSHVGTDGIVQMMQRRRSRK